WEEAATWHGELNFSYQKMNRETYFIIFPAGFSIPRAFDEFGAPSAFTVFTEGFIGAPFANDKYFNASLVTQYSGIDKHHFRVEVGYRKSEERPQEFKNFGAGVLDGTEDFVDSTLTDVTNTQYIYLDDRQRELGFLSLQDEWIIADDWEFVVGARFDKYSDFGSTINPRLALVWDTDRSWTTKFLYGQAFRAASMQELYVSNNPVTQGNPDLEPETIGFYEVVFDYHNRVDWQVTANIYAYKAEDLITASLSSAGIVRFNNVGEQDGYGVEIEAKWKPSDTFNAKFGYTWQHSESGTNGQDIPEAPKQVINLSFNWTVYENVGVHMNAHWVMDRKRAVGDTRPQIADTNWTNFTLSYKFSDNLVSKLTVRNLFDTDARSPTTVQLPEDFPNEGRGAWLSLEYHF
ncbi:MAG: TonB-dependent receptor, partial [Psychrosphaera sp.]|nr:TonB-dependent receptor [Psychrosphaera sp.]